MLIKLLKDTLIGEEMCQQLLLIAVHDWEGEQLQATWGEIPILALWQVPFINYWYDQYEIFLALSKDGVSFAVFWFLFRQERFVRRWVDALSDPRVTHEIRSIWISYWSQVSFSHTLIATVSYWRNSCIHKRKSVSVLWLPYCTA